MYNSFDWNLIHALPFSERQRKIIASVETKGDLRFKSWTLPLVSSGSGVPYQSYESQFSSENGDERAQETLGLSAVHDEKVAHVQNRLARALVAKMPVRGRNTSPISRSDNLTNAGQACEGQVSSGRGREVTLRKL